MLSLAKQKDIIDEILKERLDKVLPFVMEECDVEAWIVACREYNEDPIFHALTPAHYPTARRITILVFIHKDSKTQYFSVSMPDEELEKYYTRAYDARKESQMDALTRLLETYDPKNIAINVSDHFAFTDGLSSGLYNMLMKELPKDISERFISSDDLGIRLLETRTSLELELYPQVMDVAMQIIKDTFTKDRIQPGVTTCKDLMDYMEQRVNDLGITTWFASTIDLQRKEGMFGKDTIIQKGDLLHCDFGIRYLNLCTDTQRLCYVLKDDEDKIPDELMQAFQRNNRFQDIVRNHMKINKSGNEVFTSSIQQAKQEGIRPILYTHPLGLHGHGAGPTIGLFSNQQEIPVKGDLQLHNHTAYALELSIVEYLDMYKHDTYIFTEESVVLVDDEVHFLASGRDQIFTI